MSSHEAESNGKHLDDIIDGNLGCFTSIGSDPHEECVDASNSELKSRDGHGESGRSSSSTESKLVCDIVVVVSYVPEEEIEHELRTKTARTRCMSGMLMCLTREQRLLYILGDVFNLDHTIGAEVFGLSKQNYRVRLSRTRKEFHAFMNQQCGLVNTANPCRCSKKAKAMEAAGKMKVDEKIFDPKYSSTIASYSQGIADEVADVIDKKYIEFFQRHPTKEDFDTETVITEIVNDNDLHKYFE